MLCQKSYLSNCDRLSVRFTNGQPSVQYWFMLKKDLIIFYVSKPKKILYTIKSNVKEKRFRKFTPSTFAKKEKPIYPDYVKEKITSEIL